MDAAYLEETVGPQLCEALTAMIVAQPVDCVQFVGQHLVDYVKSVEAAEEKLKYLAELDEAIRVQEERKKEADAEAERKRLADGPTPAEVELAASLDGAVDAAAVTKGVLAAVKRATGATAVYVGHKTLSADGNPVIAFVAGDIAGETLEKGVTFQVFEQRPEYDEELAAAQQVLDEAEDEDKPKAEEAMKAVQRYPSHVLVDNVLRDERVTFFGIPQIGSYAAIPIRYDSALHPDGVGDEGPNCVPVEKALCLHTMGQSKELKDLEACETWAKRLATAFEKTDAAMYETSAAARAELKDVDVKTAAADAQTAHEEKVAADLAALDDAEADQVVAKQKLHVAVATAVLQTACVDVLTKMATNDKIPPPLPVLQLFTAALLFFSNDKESLECTGNKGVPDWSKIAPKLATDLLPALNAGHDLAPTILDAAPIMPDVKRVLDDVSPSSFSDFYASEPLARLHAWLTHVATLFDHAKAVADAQAESAANDADAA